MTNTLETNTKKPKLIPEFTAKELIMKIQEGIRTKQGSTIFFYRELQKRIVNKDLNLSQIKSLPLNFELQVYKILADQILCLCQKNSKDRQFIEQYDQALKNLIKEAGEKKIDVTSLKSIQRVITTHLIQKSTTLPRTPSTQKINMFKI
ncbi:MAG: hypothetical protein KAI16_02515 [Candidatus Pacebacteria bacterium]|nr:hypothetical protein [Candidatus Paceibacterota bacterium]